MGLLDPAKVAATQISFNVIFNQQFGQLAADMSIWSELGMPMDTENPTEQFNWLGTNPQFALWDGMRVIQKLRNYNFQIAVKDWANGLEVDENDLEDDRLGMYKPRIMQLAEQAAIHRVNLMVDYFNQGFATTVYGAGYDGVAFFGATHKDGNGPTQDNKLTATLDDAGAFDSAYAKMLNLQDENGEPLGMKPSHLICGPSNRTNALTLVANQYNANGGSNYNFDSVKVVINPKITGAHAAKWYLCDLTHPVKPLIFLQRRPVRFDEVIEGGERFRTRKMFFGASARYNVGYGMWQMAIGSDGTT
jgi:phage major head subunit gpT-like protein